MDLLKGLIFLLSFYICLSTAAVVSGIEELEEEEEDIDKRRQYVQQFVEQLQQVEYAAMEAKVNSYGTPQKYNYNKAKRENVEDLNVDEAYITGEYDVELGEDPSEIQEDMESVFSNGAELLDKQDINKNSALAKMLETMTVVENGEEKKPAGLHPDTDMKVQEESVDRHGNADTTLAVDENGKQSDNATRRGFKRNLSVDSNNYWPGGVVPYTIETKFSANSINIIKATIGELQEKTCIRFIDADSTEAKALSHNSVVHFVDGGYCSSDIGRMHSSEQQIILSEAACVNRATIIHEILHTLGFYHEQARSDRDKYVQVHTGKIRSNGLDNFESHYTINDVSYDAESVLQYNLYSFGKMVNGKVQKTMEFKDPKLEFLADMSVGLDMYDIAEINNGYKCAAHCTVIPKCENGGYVNHLCKCDCPSPLMGDTCEQVQTDSGCGGIVDVTSTTTKTIKSPNFPNNYPVGKKCVWLIRAPKYDAVKITINELSLPHNANNVCYHWLEIRYNLLGQLGPKRCGTFNDQSWVTNPNKDDNLMILMFDSYFARNRAASKGFQITATSEFRGCETHGCVYGTCVKQSSGGSRCQCPPGIAGSHCDQITKSGSLSCDFESGSECFLKNDDLDGDQLWLAHIGLTSTKYTGPKKAKEGTMYMYFESNSPSKQGDTAMLTSRDDIFFSDDTPRCLTFHYSMYGRTMGTLNVYQRGSNGVKKLIFTKSGGQGPNWKYQEVTVVPMPGLRISFEAVRGTSSTGDIGIDDVQLKAEKCIDTPAVCTFEPDDYCYWHPRYPKRRFKLRINKGKTPTTCTGPNGAYQGQYYMHLEASQGRLYRRNFFDYIIPSQEVESPHCLSFVYHKLDTRPWYYQWFHNGRLNMGRLYVRSRTHLKMKYGGPVLFNTNFGGLEDKWYKAKMTVPAKIRHLDITFQRGISFCGDICIDDIKLTLNSC